MGMNVVGKGTSGRRALKAAGVVNERGLMVGSYICLVRGKVSYGYLIVARGWTVGEGQQTDFGIRENAATWNALRGDESAIF